MWRNVALANEPKNGMILQIGNDAFTGFGAYPKIKRNNGTVRLF